MKKILCTLLLAVGFAFSAHANTEGIEWDKAPAKTTDLASLQNGAKVFITDKVGENMKTSVDPKEAKAWFGGVPPDLTVIARSRSGEKGKGADYLYTYLRTFYVDDTKATGWNNLAFPNIAMPHALWELQGKRAAIFETVQEDGHEAHVFKGWEQLTPGTMTPAQYDQTVADLVNYLVWMAEPAQNTRVYLGYAVIAFLLVLTFCAWRLNGAFWKDVK